MTKTGTYEEHPDLGGGGRGDHQLRRRGSGTADLSQFRSQSRLRPATSGLWLRPAARLRSTRSVLSQRAYGTRILPARPIPELERMPAGLDRAGWSLQTLSGLLVQRTTTSASPGAGETMPMCTSRRIRAGLCGRLAVR